MALSSTLIQQAELSIAFIVRSPMYQKDQQQHLFYKNDIESPLLQPWESQITTPIVAVNISGALENSFETLRHIFISKEGLILVGLLIFAKIASLFSHPKTHLTSARWIGVREKLAGVREAKRQLNSKSYKDVCLWIGSPPKWQTKWIMPELITILTGYPPTLYLPGANGSIKVTGKPESGKTFSVINPLLASAIKQSHPILLLDYKPDEKGQGGQMSYILTLAVRHGYKVVNVFAPGQAYSCVFNPIDHFLTGANDDTTARVLAEVFHANLRNKKNTGDAFFTPAGQRLLQALFQLAKSTKFPDLAMAFAILTLKQLPERLAKAQEENNPNFPYAVRNQFAQLIQTASANKTSSGILAGAADILTDFMSESILYSVIGKTNVNPVLNEKEILVFQSDIFRKDVINPLIAGIFNLVINKNFSFQRRVPLIVSMDEFPTFNFPDSPTWPNEHRSKLFVGIYGYQSEAQNRKRYSTEDCEILDNGLRHHVWFATGSLESANKYSGTLGETEVTLTNKSKSSNYGEKGGGSTSISQQLVKKPLMLPNDFMQMRKGECIFRSSAYEGKDRTNLPWHLRRVRIPKADRECEAECEKIWEEELLPNLIAREKKRRGEFDVQKIHREREELAEKLFPLPDAPKETSGNQRQNIVTTRDEDPDF